MPNKTIAVFCAASYTIDPKYNVVARDFVRAASLLGYTIVTGGTVKGTMGVIADELVAIGGKHIGIVPRFMTDLAHTGLTDTIWTNTLSDRKNHMRALSGAVVALPGGIGTLDELMETYTLKKLEQYKGEVYVLNCFGFYDSLEALMDYYVETEMLEESARAQIHFPKTVEELIALLEK